MPASPPLHPASRKRRAKRAAPASSPQAREAHVSELGAAFRRLSRNFSRLRGRDTHLGPGELSHAQFELLIELDERGELSVGELAAAARTAPASVTQMLDHLAAEGHVERVRSDSDRRVVVSRLTPQGQEKVRAKRAAWKARWEGALDGVSDRELRIAAHVLARLAEMVEEEPPAGSGQCGEGSERAS